MPPKAPAIGAAEQHQKKRKQPPQSSNNPQNRASKRVHVQREARDILTQTSEKALKNGELDLQAFLKAREFEIKALEDGMQKSKKALTTRAFQQVPRDMRRRTASHNAKRTPKRLQARAKREMRQDNTPTVTANKRKPGNTRARLRAETAKRLGFLSEKKPAAREAAQEASKEPVVEPKEDMGIVTRPARPKVKMNQLSEAPKPRSKFRKRQINKTWLPTHIYHAKRARMTEPKNPLWRFAIPLTPSLKRYRPTHREGGARGALCWDMSYMSTIGLNGPAESLQNVLKAVGITHEEVWGKRGVKWRAGKRSWSGCLTKEAVGQTGYTAPVTVIWSPEGAKLSVVENDEQKHVKSPQRKVLIRVHPAAFLDLWNEVLHVSKIQRPLVHAEDLRFEIGSIEITGPGSTETLLGILHPSEKALASKIHADAFLALAGLTNPASLPPNALLALSVSDPRLHYPPRKITLPKPADEEANFKLLELLSAWPVDSCTGCSSFFDKDSRYKATRLPSQKSINRRKALAPPGAYPSNTSTDPDIPIMLLASRSPTSSSPGAQGSWTLLAPWKCILPFWYGCMHYPLSSGGNPSFGGLEEQRQISFEHGVPWFPGYFPGSKAGWEWEQEQRKKRKDTWDRRPKGKRVAWEKVDLGGAKKGEIGIGWACDFERLVAKDATPVAANPDVMDVDDPASGVADKQGNKDESVKSDSVPPLPHLSTSSFVSLLHRQNPTITPPCLATIRITLFTGVPQPCARIYRLPAPPLACSISINDSSIKSAPPSTNHSIPSLRQQWLSTLPDSFIDPNTKQSANSKSQSATLKNKNQNQTRFPQTSNPAEFKRAVAQSLLQNPPLPFPAPKHSRSELQHPMLPDEDDLIGFVTTGNYNLADGKGVGLGSVLVGKMLQAWNIKIDEKPIRERERKLCIVRNAGSTTGRLAVWEAV